MKIDVETLKTIVRKAVQDALVPARVKRVEIEEDPDDGSLRVEVTVAKAEQRLPKGVLLTIVNVASDAIANAGDERFPVVFGRFAATQDFAA